jgi:hypothetical protein
MRPDASASASLRISIHSPMCELPQSARLGRNAWHLHMGWHAHVRPVVRMYASFMSTYCDWLSCVSWICHLYICYVTCFSVSICLASVCGAVCICHAVMRRLVHVSYKSDDAIHNYSCQGLGRLYFLKRGWITATLVRASTMHVCPATLLYI